MLTLNQVVLQHIRKSFDNVSLDAKIYWISPATLWISTTVTKLMFISFSFQLWIIILLHPRRFRVKSKSLVSSLAVAVLSQLLSILLIYTQTMKNCMNSILAIWDEKCSFKSEGSLPGRISTYSEGSINLILRYLLKPNRTL